MLPLKSPGGLWIIVGFLCALPLEKSVAQAAATSEVLTNSSIVQLIAAKVPKDLVLIKIRTTFTNFDVGPTGLVGLHQNKVPEDIIKTMLIAAADSSKARQSPAILTNRGIIEMVTGKLPKGIILQKIRSTSSEFSLATADLVTLNENKVSQEIVKAMMNAASASAVEPGLQTGRSITLGAPISPQARPVRIVRAAVSIAKIPKEPGIYMYADNGSGAQFQLLEPTVYTAAKSGGFIESALTAGIAKKTSKAVVRGAQASMRTSDSSVDFYFVFEEKSSGPGGANTWFHGATSANEFSLVRFTKTSNGRQVVIAAANAFGTQSGIEDKANVPFTSTRIAPRIYRVVPNEVLAEGQYAFMSAAGLDPTTRGANRLFDFGIVK